MPRTKSGAGLRQFGENLSRKILNSGVRAVSVKYNVVRGTGQGHYFPTKIIKNSGVLGYLEVRGNISHKNNKNSGFSGNFAL